MIPMLVGSRFARRTRTGPRRSKVWVGAINNVLDLAPSGSATATLISEIDIESQGKPTLARCRGSWIAHQDLSAAAATSGMWVAAGIAVLNAKAVSSGVTAMPLPISNVEFPWIWWDAVYVGIEVNTAVGIIDLVRDNRIVDSKAMP